jgi:preprotein translocase subunit SecB
LALQKAINNVQITDIFINKTYTEHKESDPLLQDYENTIVKLKHRVSKSAVLHDDTDDNFALRVYIEVGAQWVDTEDESKILSVIEASYILKYKMNIRLEKEAIDEFALKNSSYHLWPYWREFLSSTCDRMNLPKLTLPIRQLQHHSIAD